MKSPNLVLTFLTALTLSTNLNATNEFGDNISEIQFHGNKQVTGGDSDGRTLISTGSVCVSTLAGSFVITFIGGLEEADFRRIHH